MTRSPGVLVRSTSVLPYAISFVTPLRTVARSYDRRSGVYLLLHGEEGIDGVGEAAPLEGFSVESYREAEADVRLAGSVLRATHLPGSFSDIPAHLDQMLPPLVPSARFAVETAIGDLVARCTKVPLAALLDQNWQRSVLVNGLLGLSTNDSENFTKLKKLLDAGFRTVKVKLTSLPPQDAAECISRIAAKCPPYVRLRIDCNGGFTPHDARCFLATLDPGVVEYVEEPLTVFDLASYRSLASPVPLALDESVRVVANNEEFWSDPPCQVLVVKPTVLGGLFASRALVRRAQERGLKVVVTSALETTVGVAACAQLAASIGGGAAGLSTLSLFDLRAMRWHGIAVRSGTIEVGDRPGLGLVLR